jgi:hypothetical protein
MTLPRRLIDGAHLVPLAGVSVSILTGTQRKGIPRVNAIDSAVNG